MRTNNSKRSGQRPHRAKKNPKKYPPRVPTVVLKNGAKKDAQMLAVFVTSPLFTGDHQTTEEDINSWFRANVDREKTDNLVCQYFILLCYKELGREPQRPKAPIYNWIGGAKTRGWKERIEAIINLAEAKFKSN